MPQLHGAVAGQHAAVLVWSVDDLPSALEYLVEVAVDATFISYIPDSMRGLYAVGNPQVTERVEGGTLYVE